jgi:hypothetical protein
MSDYEQPPEEAADEVTVGAWLDVDEPTPERPSIVPEPSQTQKPGICARIVRALRGGS